MNQYTNSNQKQSSSNSEKTAMNNLKYEIANELGVDLEKGYNGDLTSREAGYVGGYMVKKMVEDSKKNMSR